MPLLPPELVGLGLGERLGLAVGEGLILPLALLEGETETSGVGEGVGSGVTAGKVGSASP